MQVDRTINVNKFTKTSKIFTFFMTRYVFVTAPPSKSLRNLLKQSILQKNDDLMETVNEKLVEKNRLLKTELKIQKTLKDLKQEKRKIFSLIASNMKKKKKEVV